MQKVDSKQNAEGNTPALNEIVLPSRPHDKKLTKKKHSYWLGLWRDHLQSPPSKSDLHYTHPKDSRRGRALEVADGYYLFLENGETWECNFSFPKDPYCFIGMYPSRR